MPWRSSNMPLSTVKSELPRTRKQGSKGRLSYLSVLLLRLSPSTPRYITFQDWLLGLESLGGSKGFEDFIKANPTGVETALSEAEHKEKKGSFLGLKFSSAFDTAYVQPEPCSLIDYAFYSVFNAWSNGKHFYGSKWSLAAAEVPLTVGEISYNDGMFERTKNAAVNITVYGLVADYYNTSGSWVGQVLFAAGAGYISMIVNGSWN
ncbi:hypothetical protein B0H11DRAFT_2052339 [Mycena galericulata]|nr:hypothetical protein B0H11DRAFT_2052339 [Mycena galericulata]